MKVNKCDRCGNVEKRGLVRIYDKKMSVWGQSFDLCDGCFESLLQFMGLPTPVRGHETVVLNGFSDRKKKYWWGGIRVSKKEYEAHQTELRNTDASTPPIESDINLAQTKGGQE